MLWIHGICNFMVYLWLFSVFVPISLHMVLIHMDICIHGHLYSMEFLWVSLLELFINDLPLDSNEFLKNGAFGKTFFVYYDN